MLMTSKASFIQTNTSFYLDTLFSNRVGLIIQTKSAFRVLNPQKWSLAKQSILKSEMWSLINNERMLEPKGVV